MITCENQLVVTDPYERHVINCSVNADPPFSDYYVEFPRFKPVNETDLQRVDGDEKFNYNFRLSQQVSAVSKVLRTVTPPTV